MTKQHNYKTKLTWTGNTGSGTRNYRQYVRDHELTAGEKPAIMCSSDPSFRGDPNRYNPEELLLASISGCHMLWFLHLCSVNQVVVTDYQDFAEATMEEMPDGSGRFIEATLKPRVTVTDESMIQKIDHLHHEANEKCFIANSINFPVHHAPEVLVDRRS